MFASAVQGCQFHFENHRDREGQVEIVCETINGSIAQHAYFDDKQLRTVNQSVRHNIQNSDTSVVAQFPLQQAGLCFTSGSLEPNPYGPQLKLQPLRPRKSLSQISTFGSLISAFERPIASGGGRSVSSADSPPQPALGGATTKLARRRYGAIIVPIQHRKDIRIANDQPRAHPNINGTIALHSAHSLTDSQHWFGALSGVGAQ